MVLAELGTKITNALYKMTNSDVIDEQTVDALLKEISNALYYSDVNVALIGKLKTNIKKNLNMEEISSGINKRRLVQKTVFDELCKLLDPGMAPYAAKKGKPNVIMFVGLQGSGKTTTVAKYGSYYHKKGWKVALVCADTFRAGAFAQLRQNATKVKLPFYGSETETDPVKIAYDGVEQFKREGFEIIIVDTSGRHSQEAALFEEMEQVAEAVKPNDIVFVMDSSIGQAAHDQATAFKAKVAVGSCIITKLDSSAKGGGALSAVAATKSPIIFIGTGEYFEDFEEFDSTAFVKRLLGLGDMKAFINTIQEAGIDKKPEMFERLTQGVFTLRDMYEQFQNLLKMGPLGKVMGMLPGFSADLIPKGKEKEGQARIKKFLTMMDSMTDEELDHPDISKLTNLPQRVTRIARGAGRQVHEVNEMLEEYRKFQKVVSKMKDLNLNKLKGANDMASLQKNLPGMLKGLSNSLGGMQGMGNIQNMLKQFGRGGGGGGLGGLGDLMSQFGGGGLGQ